MSTIIAGTTDTSVSITQYSRGQGKSPGYQVTWVNDRGTQWVSFDSEDKARAFYHLLYGSLDIA